MSCARCINPLHSMKYQERYPNSITPADVTIPVEVIYQTIETLHEACPNNKGDWYFTGNYPTPGGNRFATRHS